MAVPFSLLGIQASADHSNTFCPTEGEHSRLNVRDTLCAAFYAALTPYFGKRIITAPIFSSNAEKIRHREHLRKEFEEELIKIKSKKLRSDIVIRDVDRVDGYPEVIENKGISAWFRLSLLETYMKGVRVGLRIGGLTKCKGGFRFTDYKKNEKADIKVYLVGEIPFDSIVTVNWEGDEHYYFPHVYCHFNHNGEPYERLFFGEKVNMGNGLFYYKEISDYDSVSKNSAKANLKFFA